MKKVTFLTIIFCGLTILDIYSQPLQLTVNIRKDSLGVLDEFSYQFGIWNISDKKIWLKAQESIGIPTLFYKLTESQNWKKFIHSNQKTVWGEDFLGQYPFYTLEKGEREGSRNMEIMTLFQDSVFIKSIKYPSDTVTVGFQYLSDGLMADTVFTDTSRYYSKPILSNMEVYKVRIYPYRGIDSLAFNWIKAQDIPFLFMNEPYTYEKLYYDKFGKPNDVDATLALLHTFNLKFSKSRFIFNAKDFESELLAIYSIRKGEPYLGSLHKLLWEIAGNESNRFFMNKAVEMLKLYFPNDPKLKDYFKKQQNNNKE